MQTDNPSARFSASLFAVMLAVAPFVFYSGPGSFTIPRMMLIEIAAWIAVAALLIIPSGGKFLLKWQVSVFLIIYAISFAVSGNPLACVKTFIFFLSCAALAWGVCMCAVSGAVIRRLCCIIVAAGAVMSVHGMMQFLGFDLQVLKGIEFKMFATAGTPAALSGFVAVCMCILLSAIFENMNGKRLHGLYALWMLFSFCLVFSASRSGVAALAVGAVVTALSAYKSRKIDRSNFIFRVAACVIIFAAALSIMFMFFSPHSSNPAGDSPSVSGNPVAYGAQYKSGSIRQRAFTIRCGYEMWKQRPVLGSGPGTFALRYPLEQARLLKDATVASSYGDVIANRVATHAHNEYLEFAVESGVPGVIAFLVLAFSAFAVMFRNANRATRAGECGMIRFGIAGAFAALIVQSAFEFTLHDPLTGMLFWVMLGLGCACGKPSGGGVPAPGRGVNILRIFALTAAAALVLYAPTPFIAMRHMLQANALGRAGDASAALDEFSIAEKLDPASPEILLNSASAYRAAGDMPSAIGDLKRALNLSNNPEIYDAIGRTYGAAGMPREAEAAFLTAVSIDPWKVSTHYNLARLYDVWGRKSDAIAHAKKAAGLSRGYPQQEQALLQYLYKLNTGR